MTTTPFPSAGADAPADALSDERGQRARDRILLYVRGMDLPPLESLDLARESLGRAGPHADPAEAMRALRGLLDERGLAHGARNSRGERLLSAPPMNRRPMIAEELTPRRRFALPTLRPKREAAPAGPPRPAPEGEGRG